MLTLPMARIHFAPPNSHPNSIGFAQSELMA
jgi:hypothetical protein